MALRLPALDPQSLPARSTTGYPEPFRARVLPREKRALGDAAGLTKIGVNLTTLPPGKESSMRHTHTHEDELVYVLEGEVVLVTDAGEQVLGPGACAGFPAGSPDGHHLVNRSDRPARYLEISNRDEADVPLYSDVDLALVQGPDGVLAYARKDGTPY
ncbi:MAG TPA: cupin domain-containing protein [Polyangiaceae bacterium]|jgi:uncharacterized cupin superfamily protein